ncbi:GAF domain-containing protein [Methylorubrum populi]|uniref:histidine kinase dimerization/phosphoacceptor domain -containing protein n=1 Tax=Methylorubrum rhodesianum TaxID=29427 RepID=UPI00190CA8B3|nr:histidine kinase dimerization/phosphoacceptor domain -containing protein [Methylorubrum rhodesianum]MBK3405778.1 GAF domain-containing protein [Methylorubrum rhodesianum]MBY0139035.1 GAF domain-containing protein [Methylorubrum populi]
MVDPSQMHAAGPNAGPIDLPVDFDTLTPEQRDELGAGLLALDAAGKVLACNRAAGTLCGLSPEAMIGRNFFRDLVPSAHVPGFYGRFLAGRRRALAGQAFEFVFGRIPAPFRARIGLWAGADGCTWLTINPLEQIAAGPSREAVLAAISQRSRAEPVDPSLCEREPIHIPGSIQPNAVMLAADAASMEILAFSANAADVLAPAQFPPAGLNLEAVLPASVVSAIRDGLAAHTLTDGRLLRRTLVLPPREERFHLVAHAHLGRVIIELELAPERPEDFLAASPLDAELAMMRLRAAETLTEAAQIAALEIRAMTGFESVLVYRFDADWNGEAIAEDMVPDWQRPLIGLRFPASDIPAQARALYTKAKSRFVIDRDCVPVPLVADRAAGNAPIDLTFAQNRTLSPIHLEYQRNLGVDGSMSISIMVENRLWGLMIGHHRRPHYVAPETRAAATVLTDGFAMRVQEIEGKALWSERQRHLDVQGRLVRGLTRSDDFVGSLTQGSPTLLDLFGATGAGIVSDEAVCLVGTTPEAAKVRALADWLRESLAPGETTFVTDTLVLHHPAAAAYTEIASGLLAAFVGSSRQHLLFWVKPEVPSTVTWGGDPRKPVLPGSGPVAVLPRRSFERWIEERRGHSAPWARWKVALAAQLADAVEGVVLRQRRKIDELTGLLADKERLLEQKDLLTREIDHRVKNSLQIVTAFLHMQRRQIADPEARQAFSETSARVMSVARVHDSLYQGESMEQVDLGQTIQTLCSDLAGMAGDEHSVELTAEPGLMVPYRHAVALSLITTELVTNAFKYAGRPDKGARVSVTVAGGEGAAVRLKVCDDGEGMPLGWESARARGTGLGMKLIRAMLDQIGARLDVENADGACFTVHA